MGPITIAATTEIMHQDNRFTMGIKWRRTRNIHRTTLGSFSNSAVPQCRYSLVSDRRVIVPTNKMLHKIQHIMWHDQSDVVSDTEHNRIPGTCRIARSPSRICRTPSVHPWIKSTPGVTVICSISSMRLLNRRSFFLANHTHTLPLTLHGVNESSNPCPLPQKS